MRYWRTSSSSSPTHAHSHDAQLSSAQTPDPSDRAREATTRREGGERCRKRNLGNRGNLTDVLDGLLEDC